MEKWMILCAGTLTEPVAFGLRQVTMALDHVGTTYELVDSWLQEGRYLLIGTARELLVRRALMLSNVTLENRAEGAVLVRSVTYDHRPLSVAAGTDERGVMYALCELAQRVMQNGSEALAFATEIEYPAINHRILGRFLHSHRDDGWFFSDAFWDYYTTRLAMNRINRLHLITGMDTAYMSPPYPFLVETEGYEHVIADIGDDPVARRRACLERLRKIGRLCHDRGIDFALGIWQQQPWTQSQKSLVRNNPQGDRYADYAQRSIKALIEQCPEIDILSFRVNPEAGIRDESGHFDTAQEFWYGMLRAIKAAGRPVKLEMRAKGLTDSMIDYALSLGLDVTVPTKAWCEHIALPYPMLRMRQEELNGSLTNESASRRYSYDNMQRRPRCYDLQYRLWNYGSTNLLLWGDPGYVSRFVRGCLAAQATGFEFTAPLSMKGGHETLPGDDWPLHTHEDMRTYTFEDERYWMWYFTFGRLSYNPEAAPALWERELRAHAGEAWPALEEAYLASSKILPLITTAHFPEHPSMHYWPELYGSAALFAENNDEPYFTPKESPRKKATCYANADPSDEQLFCSIQEYVDGCMAGQPPRCYSPLRVADWYYALAEQTERAVAGLEPHQEVREIRASMVDFTMLAQLGYYHAFMVHAAYHLYVFQKTHATAELPLAYGAMLSAREAFAKLSELGDRYYARNLLFDTGDSTRRNGNWSDRLHGQVDADVHRLRALLKQEGFVPDDVQPVVYQSLVHPCAFPLTFTDNVPDRWSAGQNLPITLKPGYFQSILPGETPLLHYRSTNLREGAFRSIPMQRHGEAFTAVIPGAEITSAYNLYVYFSCRDMTGDVVIHPGVYHPESILPVRLIDTGNE